MGNAPSGFHAVTGDIRGRSPEREEENAMEFKKIQDAFVHELNGLYDAEKQINEALPKMRKAASSSELKQA